MPSRRPHGSEQLVQVRLDGARGRLGRRQRRHDREVLLREERRRSVRGVVAIPPCAREVQLLLARFQSRPHRLGELRQVGSTGGGVVRRKQHRVVQVPFGRHDPVCARLVQTRFDLLARRDPAVGEDGHFRREQVDDAADLVPRGESRLGTFGFARATVDGDELGAGGVDVRGVVERFGNRGEDADLGDDRDGQVLVQVRDCPSGFRWSVNV